MINIFNPGNLGVVFFLCITLGVPLSVLALGIFLVIRRIPSRLLQCLVPLVAGIIAGTAYTLMDPSNPGNSGLVLFLTGMTIHPLLVLSPIMILHNYLHRIPVYYAVFFTAFISLGFLFAWGAAQGDQVYVETGNFVGQMAGSVITDLIVASVASGLILGLDRFLLSSEQKNS